MKDLISQALQSKKRSVILVRHAETAMNDENVSRGWTDVPLDEDMYTELIEVGKSLKQYPIDGIVASDLLRTLQTAHCLSVGSGAPVLSTESFLHTWNTGIYTGKNADKVDAILEKLATEEPYKTIEDGESFEAFKYRFLMGLIGYLNSNPGKLFVFTTHGRNLALLNAWAQMEYNESLEVSPYDLGYEDYEPGSGHYFEIDSSLIK